MQLSANPIQHENQPERARPGRSRRDRVSAHFPVAATVLAVALLFGCSGGQSGADATSTMRGWFGGKTDGHVAYATADAPAVLAEAAASSKAVGRLRGGEKVLRSTNKNGFAYVEARGGKLKGWVPAAKLSSQPPGAATAGKPAARVPVAGSEAGPAEEAAAPASSDLQAEQSGDDAEAAAEPASAAEPAVPAEEDAPPLPSAPAPPRPAPAKAAPTPGKTKGIAPSVFDPY